MAMRDVRGLAFFLVIVYTSVRSANSSTTSFLQPSTTTTSPVNTSTTSQATTRTTSPPLCTPVNLTLKISSDLPVRNQTRLDVQCRVDQNLLLFEVGEGGIDTDFTIRTFGGYPYFQNNVIPSTFKRKTNFTINVTVYVGGRPVQGIQLNILVVEINDPPVIQTQSAAVEEGPIPVLEKHQIVIRIRDPDAKLNNSWSKITVTAKGLPEQLMMGSCPQTCLKIVKPFDADIYKPKSPRGKFPSESFPDFEERPNYDERPYAPIINFTIMATDGGNLSSSAVIRLTILDRNDNPPVCQSPGKVYVSPDYKPDLNRKLRGVPELPGLNGLIRLSNYCSDADYSLPNMISPNGYRILEPEDCPSVFSRGFAGDLHTDVRYLQAGRKSCHVTVVVTDPNFATTMSFQVVFGRCPAGYDKEGRYWNATDPGSNSFAPCPDGYLGRIIRQCDQSATFKDPLYQCTLQTLTEIYGKVMTKEPITEIVRELSNISTIPTQLYEGDILQITQIVRAISMRSDLEPVNYTAIAADFLTVANTLIEDNNTNTWKSLISTGMFGAETVMKQVETFAEKLLMGNGSEGAAYGKSNMYIKVGRAMDCTKGISFPNRDSANLPNWAKKTQDHINLGCGKGYSSFTTALYRNVSGMMKTEIDLNGTSSKNKKTLINSPVLSLTLFPKTDRVLDSPAVVTFEVFDKNLTEPVCSYWKYNKIPGQGQWATDGCSLDSYNRQTGVVVCKCNHLTNFAVLMSPFSEISEADQIALSIISVIGCVISCIGLVITVTLHVVFYRTVRSDRTTILLNLCSTLFLAYIIFLAGVKRTESKALCTTISILLHYLYLCVFFIMLAEGVDLAYRAFSRTTKYRIGIYFTIGAYVVSGVIVLISAGASQLQGYGNSQSCWLSVDSGLIWSFITPALIIILVNITIAVCVLRQMFGLSAVQQKSKIEKAKTGVRSILVILPIMGLAWIFGVFSVSRSTVVFQYLFALLNSTQGLLIFVFHCVLNKKIQDSFRSAKTRFLSQDSESKTNTKKTDASEM